MSTGLPYPPPLGVATGEPYPPVEVWCGRGTETGEPYPDDDGDGDVVGGWPTGVPVPYPLGVGAGVPCGLTTGVP